MNESLDEYVIETTPLNKHTKTSKFRRKQHKIPSANLEKKNSTIGPELDMLTQLVNECNKCVSEDLVAGISSISLDDHKFNQGPASPPVENNNINSYNSKIVDNGFVAPLQTTRSRNTYKLYVFYLIEEILNFTPNYYPKNSNIQVVGITEYSEASSSCYLSSLEPSNEETAAIKLDDSQLPTVPTCGEEIVMFCDLVFDRELPMIVGNFFQKFTLIFSTYKELMLKLRTTVPLENLEIISMPEDTLDSNDDSKEDIFNLTLKYNSEICQSETVINAFLNDSSFTDV